MTFWDFVGAIFLANLLSGLGMVGVRFGFMLVARFRANIHDQLIRKGKR